MTTGSAEGVVKVSIRKTDVNDCKVFAGVSNRQCVD